MARRRTHTKFKPRPQALGKELQRRVTRADRKLQLLAQALALQGEAEMKRGAPWNDQTGYARGSLYGRAQKWTIILGTSNNEYGVFLELGTVKMAPRPIIIPTLNKLAPRYWMDAVVVLRSELGG